MELYRQGEVSVSTTLLRVRTASYPIAGISSVWISKDSRQVRFVGWGITIAFVSYVFLSLDSYWGWFWIVTGLALIVLGIMPFRILCITTLGREQQALSSTNRKALLAVKAAIERAIELRG